MRMNYNIQNEQTCPKAVTPLSVRPATVAPPSTGKDFSFRSLAFFSSTNSSRHLSIELSKVKVHMYRSCQSLNQRFMSSFMTKKGI